MRALVVMTKANRIFAGSFLEAAEEKKYRWKRFVWMKGRNVLYLTGGKR